QANQASVPSWSSVLAPETWYQVTPTLPSPATAIWGTKGCPDEVDTTRLGELHVLPWSSDRTTERNASPSLGCSAQQMYTAPSGPAAASTHWPVPRTWSFPVRYLAA